MYRSVWKNFIKSVCSINYINRYGIQFYRTSGFRYKDYLVSGYCPEEVRKARRIEICFCPEETDGHTIPVNLTVREFRERLSGNVKNGSSGLMLIRMKSDELGPLASVEMTRQSDAEIGTPVAIIACSRQMSQLSIKTGMISSRVCIRGENFLLVESSIEQGNSGAPLINGITGDVIGVMVDSVPSPAQNHRKLKRIVDNNIRMLNNATGRFSIGDIDPAQVLVANQYMIKHLVKELYLSSHRSIGFSVPVDRVLRYIRNIEHISEFRTLNREDSL